MNYETLLYDVEDHVAHITLNRPEALNAISASLAVELLEAVLRAEQNPQVRAVLLTGSGKVFCGGGDLKAFQAEGENITFFLKRLACDFHGAIARISRMKAPVIAAVHGTTAGAGVSLAISCDLTLIAESAKLMLAYTGVGLCPDGSSTYYLPRLIGLKRAMELALTNRRVTAQEAVEWGLANRVVPDDELLTEARNLALQLAAGPTHAFATAKRLLRTGLGAQLETQMELEGESLADLAARSDAQEGFAAFAEKRKPLFTGE